MEYKELALESGIENWGRVPALGCKSSFIADLADAVIEALPSASSMSTTAASTTKKKSSENANIDPLQYAAKIFFGSFLAFILLLSPKLVSFFRGNPML